MYLRESHSLYRIENKGETSNYNVPTDIPKRYVSDLKVCQWTAQSWLGWRGSRPIFFSPTCASPMHFPLFPRPSTVFTVGDTDSRTRVQKTRNRRRARWKREEEEEEEDGMNGGASRRKGWKQGVGWRGWCIKAQSEMFAGQKPTRPKICFGKWRARELGGRRS